ncbi:MAG: UvrD-helicase domain-containing protein, partial [Ignavibacteriales bacterium]|nr:UvrD-helicase domain-containing protein [Ignavibacteriales bacterium]
MNFTPLSEKEKQELIFDELDKSDYSQESITKKTAEDSGSQKWHWLKDTDWERIELYTKDDFDLYLYLTPDQIAVLKTPPPVLLSGTAGSGKTTIGVYYLLKAPLSSHKKLFITYNKFLKTSAERLYAGLLNSEKSAGSFVYPDFYTYKEFCLQTVNRFNKKFLPENEINFDRFTSLMQQNRSALRFDIPLLWEEFRAIIKGALPQLNSKLFSSAIQKIKTGKTDTGFLNILLSQFIVFSKLESSDRIEHFIKKHTRVNFPDFLRNFEIIIAEQPERIIPVLESILELFAKQKELTQKKNLSFMEYELLGKKKAPNFNFDRKEIYRVFEWYQDKLESEKLWDELDLTKETIALFTEKEMADYQYDLVICDEVQDLTDIQHDLLFYLTKNPLNLILTGDTKQIINPSGFRWEELKRHFYERNLKIPGINFLSLNFRSSGSIVELSNCLLDIKTELLGLSSDQLKEDWKFKSRPPVIIAGLPETKLINSLRTTGAGKTILVRTEDQKNHLKSILETDLIFTISEAKGLEFDTVLLWKFCSEKHLEDVWRTILSDNYSQLHSAKIKHEINLLYVAITRAQKDLLIYDGLVASVIWENERISEKVVISNDVEFINNIWNVLSSPEEWLEQGVYYFDREYYLAAIECFKNAGATDRLLKTEALYYEQKGNFIQAAKRFEQLNELEKAARYFEKASAFAQAVELWLKLKRKDEIIACQRKLYEHEKNYAALAEIYIKLKDLANAAECYTKDKNYAAASDIFVKLKKYERAAHCYELSGQLEKAAPFYAKAKEFEKSAELFEKIHDYVQAAVYWKKSKNKNRLLTFYQRTNNIPLLVEFYFQEKDHANVIRTLKKGYTNDQLRLQTKFYFESGKFLMANLVFQVLLDEKGIAETFLKLKKYGEAGSHFEINGDFYEAGNAFVKGKNFNKAFVCYIQSPEDKKDEYRKAVSIAPKVRGKGMHEITQSFFSNGKFEFALQCSLIDKHYLNTGICYTQLRQYDKAVEFWKHDLVYKRVEQVAKFCLSINKPELCARVVLEIDPAAFNGKDMPFIPAKDSQLVVLMDKYFTSVSSHDAMFIWAERLSKMDWNCNYALTVCTYYEKSRNFNAYLKYVHGLQYKNSAPEKLIKNHLKNIAALYPGQVNEMTAIAFENLKNQFKYDEVISQLELNEKNYLLFLGSAQSAKACDLLIEKESPQTI